MVLSKIRDKKCWKTSNFNPQVIEGSVLKLSVESYSSMSSAAIEFWAVNLIFGGDRTPYLHEWWMISIPLWCNCIIRSYPIQILLSLGKRLLLLHHLCCQWTVGKGCMFRWLSCFVWVIKVTVKFSKFSPKRRYNKESNFLEFQEYMYTSHSWCW